MNFQNFIRLQNQSSACGNIAFRNCSFYLPQCEGFEIVFKIECFAFPNVTVSTLEQKHPQHWNRTIKKNKDVHPGSLPLCSGDGGVLVRLAKTCRRWNMGAVACWRTLKLCTRAVSQCCNNSSFYLNYSATEGSNGDQFFCQIAFVQIRSVNLSKSLQMWKVSS